LIGSTGIASLDRLVHVGLTHACLDAGAVGRAVGLSLIAPRARGGLLVDPLAAGIGLLRQPAAR
jgi:hypothetical protein